MTEIKVTKKNNKVIRVECLGHTDYGTHGEDVVCAALSSIIQTAALGLLGVAQIDINLKRDDTTGYLLMTIGNELDEITQIRADAILDTMLLGVRDLHETYSDFIDLKIIK